MHGSHDRFPKRSESSKDRIGHNALHMEPAQWQVPHINHEHHEEQAISDEYKDLDLVEKAFIEALANASDTTSLLRLSGIPFVGINKEGVRLHLLRVEHQSAVDVGSLTPHLGGGSFHYSPLPAKMSSRRDALTFTYHDEKNKLVPLSLHEARELQQAERTES